MTENGRTLLGFPPRKGGFRLVLMFWVVCLLAVVLTGCQREVSKGDAVPGQVELPDERPGSARKPRGFRVRQGVGVTGAGSRCLRWFWPDLRDDREPCLIWGKSGRSKHTGEFRFTNTGNAPLKILQIHGCCGARTRGRSGPGISPRSEWYPGIRASFRLDADPQPNLGISPRRTIRNTVSCRWSSRRRLSQV